MKHHVTFIGAASSWGAAYRGPEQAPLTLWVSGLAEAVQRPHVTVDWHGLLEPMIPAPEEDLPLYEVYPNLVSMLDGLAREIEEILYARPMTMPVIVGGDHSLAMGTWSGVVNALDAHGQFGLLWIDAHMDAHTPVDCMQGKWGGHFHGMPLAHLLGEGDKKLCEFGSKKNKLRAKHVALVGIRSFEPAEEERLKRLGATIFTMDDIAREGLDTIMKKALDVVSRAPKGWGLSFDFDALDPVDMPAVGTPEAGGIRLQELLHVLSAVKLPSKPKALEFVEYIPSRDKGGAGLSVLEKILWLLLKK